MKATILPSKHPDLKIAMLLERLASKGMPDDCREIFRGRNVVAVTADGKLCIKQYREPGLIKGAIYRHLRAPKARRAYENALRLRELGVSTPEPVGAVLISDLACLGRSYYVCRYVSGASELRGVERRADFPAIARALAQFMLDMHRKGVYMKDFTMGNILFRQVRGAYSFTLVDINRMDFGVTDRELLLTNFKALLDTPEGVHRVACEYAALAGEPDPEAFVARMDAIYAAHQVKVERHKRHKKILKKLKP
ncbi:MAG: lipopolysaccharide kinase InaA family protein [Muribaculaceae bacterium]|nr:lipopolysaccharide kinase InaA family protein [Muribaculaceae bacterium]